MSAVGVAIVTGASRGLGFAFASRLVSEGWRVVVDATDGAALSQAVTALGKAVITVPGDVSHEAHRLALVDAARRLGGLDLLVNNASLLGPSPQPQLADYRLEVLRRVYEVNTFAPLALIQACLPLLAAASQAGHTAGTIINISSDAAIEGYAGWGGYGSSKAALEQLSRVLAAEQPELRIYWVDPGDMNTRMHQEAYPGEDISDRPPPDESALGLLRLLKQRPPSGRYRAREIGPGS